MDPRDLNEVLERDPYHTYSTGVITTKFPNTDRMEHAGHFPTFMEMCMDDHLTLITEKTQQQHFQDKTSEQSCSTHSHQKKSTALSHAEFPPGMENAPLFPGKQFLQVNKKFTLPDIKKMSVFLGNQFLQGREKFMDTGTFTLGTNMITTCNSTRNPTHILMIVQPQDSLSNKLD